jgi:peptidyl-prolyl cis-trans isomerase D
MALINTLREKMTKWVVGAIALSMGAFIVGSDLFGSGQNSIFGGQDREVGEIAGNSISLDDYQFAIQERKNSYILNFGRQPGERENATLEAQAWEQLINRNAIQPEYEKVGIRVTSDEVWDMLQGKNIDEGIRTAPAFTDSSGRFDRTRLISYLKQIDALPPTHEQRYRWDVFKNELKPSRERLKYENLLLKTAYITDAEGERDYHNQNDRVEMKFLYVPYFADTTTAVPDAELRDYYDKNKKKYKAENTRSMSYVAIDVNPSADDTVAIRDEVTRMSIDLKSIADDSVFAVTNSDAATPYGKYSIATLPPTLLSQRESLTAGQIIGPLLEDGRYRIYKISQITKDTIYNFKASHILIRWDADTPEGKKAAKAKAQKILKDIKSGASFAAKAREFGTDGTASSGGDLGWFVSGDMDKDFEKPIFDARKTGLLPEPVYTKFGYHIIEVTNLKDNTAYKVATVEREITPSDETLNTMLRKADAFAADLSGVDAFKEKAKLENLSVFDANDVGTAERRINNLGEARQVVTWLFREAEIGKVSTVFDLTDTYVVAVMTGETEEGFKSFDKVKEEITPAVRNQVRGRNIVAKLKGKTEPLEELAKLFPRDAVVNSSSDLRLNATSLPSIGFDPVIIGAAFSIEGGKRSTPLTGENGVVVMDVANKTEAVAMEDYTMFKTQLMNTLSGRGGYFITEALKDAAKVEDKRYKFF